MDKYLEKRFSELERRIERLRSEKLPTPQRTGETRVCPGCQAHVEAALSRADAMTRTLQGHASHADDDVRDRLLTQSILADLASAAAHFRDIVHAADVRTSAVLDGARAIERRIDRALAQLSAPSIAENADGVTSAPR